MEVLPFSFGNHTDKGIVRKVNEDAMAFYAINDSYLLMVADGMGGHAAGDEASRIAIETISDYFHHLTSFHDIPQEIIYAIELANQKIYQHAQQNPEKKGMGTTIVLAFIHGDLITIAHVGDSRAYRYNPETGLQVLTKDHSFVQELVNQGIISEEEAHYHPRKNEITRALGIKENVIPDIQQHTIRNNDVYALMTDGICSLLTANQIQNILSDINLNPQQMAEQLVNTANQLGGYDNSTVQILALNNRSDKHSIISENISLNSASNTQNLQNPIDDHSSEKKHINLPKSNTEDSYFRYYLFISASILTITVILYFFLFNLPSNATETNTKINIENEQNKEIFQSKNDSFKKTKVPTTESLFMIYKIKQNDNLQKLSKWFNYPLDSIKEKNNLNSEKLKIGQKLKFPIQTIHIVQSGDKIETIAKNYGVKESDIKKINNLKNPSKINLGDTIYIPLGEK